MNRCPACSGSVEELSPDQVVITWDREGERELVMHKYHRSCFIGDSHLSRLAGNINFLARRILDDDPRSMTDDEYADLREEAEEMLMDAIKWLEPEE